MRWQVRQNVKARALKIYRAMRQRLEAEGVIQADAHEQALAEVYARARGVTWGTEPKLPKIDVMPQASSASDAASILSPQRISEMYAKRREAAMQRAKSAYSAISRTAIADGESRQTAHEEGVAEVAAQGRFVASHSAMIRRDLAERQAQPGAVG